MWHVVDIRISLSRFDEKTVAEMIKLGYIVEFIYNPLFVEGKEVGVKFRLVSAYPLNEDVLLAKLKRIKDVLQWCVKRGIRYRLRSVDVLIIDGDNIVKDIGTANRVRLIVEKILATGSENVENEVWHQLE